MSTTEPSSTETVESGARWPLLVPVVGIIALLAVALVTTSGDDTGETADPTTSASTAAAPSTSTTADESATSTSRPPRPPRTTSTLADSVDVSDIDLRGVVYARGLVGRLARIDLVSGDVERVSVGEFWQLRRVGELVVAIGESVTLITPDLEIVADIEGSFLAARPGEFWTHTWDPPTGAVRELRRHDAEGNVEQIIPTTLPFIVGDFIDDRLHVASTGATWRVEDDGTVTRVDASVVSFDPFVGPTNVQRRCEPNQLVCRTIVAVNGREIIVADDATAPWRVSISPSERFLLTEGMDGVRIVDLTGDAGTIRGLSDDSWAVGADLLVRGTGLELALVDPLTDRSWTLLLPSDVRVRDVRPLVVVEPPDPVEASGDSPATDG